MSYSILCYTALNSISVMLWNAASCRQKGLTLFAVLLLPAETITFTDPRWQLGMDRVCAFLCTAGSAKSESVRGAIVQAIGVDSPHIQDTLPTALINENSIILYMPGHLLIKFLVLERASFKSVFDFSTLRRNSLLLRQLHLI